MKESPDDYLDFIRRVRGGDEKSAEDLVRLYEPEIRMEIRAWLRLRDPRLRRVFDSMDICQSVMGDFFARTALGDFDLDEPTKLIRLLVGMARNKLAERSGITTPRSATSGHSPNSRRTESTSRSSPTGRARSSRGGNSWRSSGADSPKRRSFWSTSEPRARVGRQSRRPSAGRPTPAASNSPGP